MFPLFVAVAIGATGALTELSQPVALAACLSTLRPIQERPSTVVAVACVTPSALAQLKRSLGQ